LVVRHELARRPWRVRASARRAGIAALMAVMALPALAATPREVFERAAAQPMVARSVSLADLGIATAIVLNDARPERVLFFRLPSGLPLLTADAELLVEYVKAERGQMFLSASVDGNPGAAVEFDTTGGSSTVRVPVATEPRSQPFAQIGLRFAASALPDNPCMDRSALGSGIAVSPRSRFNYQASARAVTDLRTAWQSLPRHTVILLPQPTLTPRLYEASLRVALALRETGRQVDFRTLPAPGTRVDLAGLEVPPPLAGLPAFRRFASERTVALETRAERAAYLVLLALAGHGIGDVLIGESPAGALAADLDALGHALERDDTEAADAFAAWRQATAPTDLPAADSNLALVRLLGQPAILLRGEQAGAGAALVGSRWRTLAGGAGILAQAPAEPAANGKRMPLERLGTPLTPQTIADAGEWIFSLAAAQLPPDRWPSQIELEMTIAPDPTRTAPVVSVFLNDALLRAESVTGTGTIARVTADVPKYLLAARNTLRVTVQRGPGPSDCRAPRGYPAQILPTSHITLAGSSDDSQFYALLPRLARAGHVAVPSAYLENAIASLPFVATVLRAAGLNAGSVELDVLADAAGFAAAAGRVPAPARMDDGVSRHHYPDQRHRRPVHRRLFLDPHHLPRHLDASAHPADAVERAAQGAGAADRHHAASLAGIRGDRPHAGEHLRHARIRQLHFVLRHLSERPGDRRGGRSHGAPLQRPGACAPAARRALVQGRLPELDRAGGVPAREEAPHGVRRLRAA
jgi:hypothetical protein